MSAADRNNVDYRYYLEVSPEGYQHSLPALGAPEKESGSGIHPEAERYVFQIKDTKLEFQQKMSARGGFGEVSQCTLLDPSYLSQLIDPSIVRVPVDDPENQFAIKAGLPGKLDWLPEKSDFSHGMQAMYPAIEMEFNKHVDHLIRGLRIMKPFRDLMDSGDVTLSRTDYITIFGGTLEHESYILGILREVPNVVKPVIYKEGTVHQDLPEGPKLVMWPWLLDSRACSKVTPTLEALFMREGALLTEEPTRPLQIASGRTLTVYFRVLKKRVANFDQFPHNVMYDSFGHPLFIDMGLAAHYGDVQKVLKDKAPLFWQAIVETSVIALFKMIPSGTINSFWRKYLRGMRGIALKRQGAKCVFEALQLPNSYDDVIVRSLQKATQQPEPARLRRRSRPNPAQGSLELGMAKADPEEEDEELDSDLDEVVSFNEEQLAQLGFEGLEELTRAS